LFFLVSVLLSPTTSETTMTWNYPINLSPSTPVHSKHSLESSLSFPFASLYVELTASDLTSSDSTIAYSAILSFPTLDPSLQLDYSGSAENGSAISLRYRFEPCGTHDLVDMDHQIAVTIAQRSDGSYNMTGVGSLTLDLQETFVGELPYEGRVGEGKGLDEFKTVMMESETGSLEITLSSESYDVNEVIPEIIVATGSQCIYTFDDGETEERKVYAVPDGKRFSMTVPVRDIWYIAFKNNRIDELEDAPVRLRIEYMESEEQLETSSSFKNGIYLNLIVGLILMIYYLRNVIFPLSMSSASVPSQIALSCKVPLQIGVPS